MSEKYTAIVDMVKSLEEDVEKFYVKGNSMAGTRLRKGLNELKVLAKEMRDDIQEVKAQKKSDKE